MEDKSPRSQEPGTQAPATPEAGSIEDLEASKEYREARAELLALRPPARFPLLLQCIRCRSPFLWLASGVVMVRDEDTSNRIDMLPAHLKYNAACLIEDEVRCPNCNADRDYHFVRSPLALLSEVIEKCSDEGSRRALNVLGKTIQVATPMTADGRKISMAAQLLETDDALWDDPCDVKSLIRRANLLKRMGRSSSAMASLEKAVLVDPLSLEAKTTLAHLLIRGGDHERARGLLVQAATEAIDGTGTLYVDERDDVLMGITTFLAMVRREVPWTQVDETLYQSMQLKSGLYLKDRKVGDDPASRGGPVKAPSPSRSRRCPCGSGHKYKKCCGRSA